MSKRMFINVIIAVWENDDLWTREWLEMYVMSKRMTMIDDRNVWSIIFDEENDRYRSMIDEYRWRGSMVKRKTREGWLLSKKMLIDDKENDDRQIIIDADRKQRELSTLVANKENDYLLTRMVIDE